MRGDSIVEGQGWSTDEWMSLPGGDGSHRVRFWIAHDEVAKRFRLSATPAEPLIGLEVVHRNPDTGRECGGYIAPDLPIVHEFRTVPTGHTIVSVDPLTVSPSLQCDHCPSHGFIRDGQWVDA